MQRIIPCLFFLSFLSFLSFFPFIYSCSKDTGSTSSTSNVIDSKDFLPIKKGSKFEINGVGDMIKIDVSEDGITTSIFKGVNFYQLKSGNDTFGYIGRGGDGSIYYYIARMGFTISVRDNIACLLKPNELVGVTWITKYDAQVGISHSNHTTILSKGDTMMLNDKIYTNVTRVRDVYKRIEYGNFVAEQTTVYTWIGGYGLYSDSSSNGIHYYKNYQY